jgi:hypothetical protein
MTCLHNLEKLLEELVSGDSMQQKFFNGQVVFINSSLDCNDGDYGIFPLQHITIQKYIASKRKLETMDHITCILLTLIIPILT